jgi:hypothetical protein
MTRVVSGADGRAWTVRGWMEWTPPASSDDFEHDVNGGATAGVVMGVVLLAMVVVLIVWMPQQVILPLWLPLIICAVLLFFPVRWLLRRPWTLVAETSTVEDEEEQAPERWVGTVRGMFKVRSAAARVSRDIQVYSAPDNEGPLQPVD